MNTNKSRATSLKSIFGKLKTTLLEFTMSNDAIIRFIPIVRRLNIPYELEKRLKENLIVLEIDQDNSEEAFWISFICDQIKECYTKGYGFYFAYERKIEEAIHNIFLARK